MELSSEDTFRLNVLLANQVTAIRINESTMVVHALTEKGEAKVPLNPTCGDDRYLRAVRELLSGHAMGSPGGYPVYLKGWTRMGQARGENLQQLLLLGEPEAVVAVVCASDITDALARRAWWCDATADNARRMLCAQGVITGEMGRVLAHYLAEHLAFEDDPQVMFDTVSLILQPGLIDEDTKLKIWRQAKHKNTYIVGFLKTLPHAIPEPLVAHPQYDFYHDRLAALCAADNAFAKMCVQVLSAAGQTYLQAFETVLKRPNNQDVVTDLFETLRYYFSALQTPGYQVEEDGDVDWIIRDVRDNGAKADAVSDVLAIAPELAPMLETMMIFSRLGYSTLRPVFSKTTAIGTLMRKKLKPVTEPLFSGLETLRRPLSA